MCVKIGLVPKSAIDPCAKKDSDRIAATLPNQHEKHYLLMKSQSLLQVFALLLPFLEE